MSAGETTRFAVQCPDRTGWSDDLPAVTPSVSELGSDPEQDKVPVIIIALNVRIA
jgi:hypothetical protein